MDSTLAALVARFPRVQWRAEKDYHVGQCDGVDVAVWDDGSDLDSWRARGIVGTVRLFTRAASAVEAVEKLAGEPEFAAALDAAPVQPTPVVEYQRYPDAPPKVERFSFGYIFWNIAKLWVLGEIKAALRGLSGVTWGDAVALLLLLGMALGCGASGMWWLSGGAR